MSASESQCAPERWRLDWPTSSGRRVGEVSLKSEPADFFVDEDLDLPADSSGEHLYLRLEKTGDNTDFVARQLAGLAECRHFDVGFCGLKDRHAITRQWFSLYRPGMEAEDESLIARIAETWPVLASARGPKKLRRGEHQGNRFEIILRNVEGDPSAINAALDEIRKNGCPNYFGPQRFGHSGANLDHAIAMDPSRMLSGRRRNGKKRGRGRSGSGSDDGKNVLYFSAARSWLFNEVLANRVAAGNWREPMAGEPGAGEARATGPMWGDGGTQAELGQGDLERKLVAGHPEVQAVFASTRMKAERRNLVMMPGELDWQWPEAKQLHVSFWLAPGQYATTLLNDVFEIRKSGENRANSVVQ